MICINTWTYLKYTKDDYSMIIYLLNIYNLLFFNILRPLLSKNINFV